MTAILLILLVLASWLGTVGFLRLRTPLQRLHCVTFVTVAACTCLLLAALAAEGPTLRVGKLCLLLVVMLAAGAGTSHAIGRAVLIRDRLEPGVVAREATGDGNESTKQR